MVLHLACSREQGERDLLLEYLNLRLLHLYRREGSIILLGRLDGVIKAASRNIFILGRILSHTSTASTQGDINMHHKL